MKKLKLLPTLFMLVLCVGVLAIGVFAITPTKNTISGTITVNASNPEVKISAYKYGADGNMLTTPFIAEQTVRSGINLNLGTDLAFDLSGVNTDTELVAKTIKIAIKIVNPGSNSLGAYFSEKEITGALQNETDKITNKTLTTEKEVGASVNTVLTDYTKVTGSNGEAFMILEFNLTAFPTDNTTVDLSKTANKMYLNIETFNEDFVIKDDAYYRALNYLIVGTSGQELTQAQVTTAISNAQEGVDTTKIKIADGVTIIGLSAFYDCSSIASIIIPEGVTGIWGCAFLGCSSLTSITIPKSVTVIGGDAFADSGIKTITVKAGSSNFDNNLIRITGKVTLNGEVKNNYTTPTNIRLQRDVTYDYIYSDLVIVLIHSGGASGN